MSLGGACLSGRVCHEQCLFLSIVRKVTYVERNSSRVGDGGGSSPYLLVRWEGKDGTSFAAVLEERGEIIFLYRRLPEELLRVSIG